MSIFDLYNKIYFLLLIFDVAATFLYDTEDTGKLPPFCNLMPKHKCLINTYRVGQNETTDSWPWFCQILTDLQNLSPIRYEMLF